MNWGMCAWQVCGEVSSILASFGVCGSSIMSKPSELFGIPSWSRASLDGPIKVSLTNKYFKLQYKEHTIHRAEILESEVVRVGTTQASQIISGKIVARSRLLFVQMQSILQRCHH
jgi:hypothetical protein